MSIREKMKDGTVHISGGKQVEAWPIDSIFITMNPANPGDYMPGTWVRFAVGRMLVGVNEGDETWDYEGKTGGEKTHILTEAEMPDHDHAINHDHASAETNSAGGHFHTTSRRAAAAGSTGHAIGSGVAAADGVTSTDGEHFHDVNIPNYFGSSGSAGNGLPHNNLPPFVAVYMYRRTA